MLNSLRRAAARTVKPRVSPATWERLRSIESRWRSHGRPAIDAANDAFGQHDAAADDLEGRKSSGHRSIDALPGVDDNDLTSLARYFGTDKWGTHRYAPHYERHFRRFKNEEFTLLEIGIGGYGREGQGGASLRMWKAFFPKAHIIGLDIEDKSFVEEPRISAYRGSQTDGPLIHTIVNDAKNLRVVVDDGSHRPEHIRRTFEILFPLLPADSLYAVEDLQTSYWPRYGGSLDLHDSGTSMGLVKRLVDGLNYEEWQDEDNPATEFDRNLVAVHCYHNLVILEKSPNHEGTRRGSGDRARPVS